MISIRLPDGSKRSFDAPVRVADVAAAIGPGLAKAALAGRVDGRLVDTSFLVDRDADVAIVTDRDADGLEVLRHSTAHLLAYAVKELFPEAQVTIGPVIDNGFYYDFSFARGFTPADLEAIETKMAELVRKDEPVVREVWKRDDAVKFFESIGEKYKAEIIASIPANEDISLYREGNFIDLCRGPHDVYHRSAQWPMARDFRCRPGASVGRAQLRARSRALHWLRIRLGTGKTGDAALRRRRPAPVL